MINLFILVPVALFLGALGLAAFFWSIRTGQFDDPDGDAMRVLFDEDAPAGAVKPDRAAPDGRSGSPRRPAAG